VRAGPPSVEFPETPACDRRNPETRSHPQCRTSHDRRWQRGCIDRRRHACQPAFSGRGIVSQPCLIPIRSADKSADTETVWNSS
jgi:hypothetical protein